MQPAELPRRLVSLGCQAGTPGSFGKPARYFSRKFSRTYLAKPPRRWELCAGGFRASSRHPTREIGTISARDEPATIERRSRISDWRPVTSNRGWLLRHRHLFEEQSVSEHAEFLCRRGREVRLRLQESGQSLGSGSATGTTRLDSCDPARGSSGGLLSGNCDLRTGRPCSLLAGAAAQSGHRIERAAYGRQCSTHVLG
jgi:hypothetical protein